MRALFVAVLLGLAATPSAQSRVAHVPPDPTTQTVGSIPPPECEPFVEPLSAYGRWFVYDGYGWVWTPTVVSPDWRPYSVGRWVWTDSGWMWLSAEPFGWATFHYGRWFYDGAYGWIWVPDSVWGPAWTCWRSGPMFYGWAPLPPGGTAHGRCDPWIGGWIFIGADVFLVSDVHVYVVPAARNDSVHDRTEPSPVETSTSRWPTRVVVGPDPAEVAVRTGRVAPVLSIARETLDGDRVRIARPDLPEDREKRDGR